RFATEHLDGTRRLRRNPGQTEVHAADPSASHGAEELHARRERRLAHRRALQAVPQRIVENRGRPERRRGAFLEGVPIVDERADRHAPHPGGSVPITLVPSETTRKLIRARLAAEVGRIERSAPTRVALVYPSPYRVGMSSLGYQSIYSTIQSMPG